MDPLYLTISIFLLRVTMGLRLLFPAWIAIQKGKDIKNAWLFFVMGLILVFGIFVPLASMIGVILAGREWYLIFSKKRDIFNEWLVYIPVFLLLIMVNAGIWWGFDYLLLQIPVILKFYQANQWVQWIL